MNQLSPSFALTHVTPSETVSLQALQQDIEIRDQLVKQLSEEMYRLIVEQPELFANFYQARKEAQQANQLTEQTLQQLTELQHQALALADQISFYQTQIEQRDQEIQKRDQEIQRLQGSLHEYNERNQMLEKVIQEMPDVYRQKFSERLATVKHKLESLQQENQQLRIQVRQLQNQANNGARNSLNLDLPGLPALGQGRLLPSLS